MPMPTNTTANRQNQKNFLMLCRMKISWPVRFSNKAYSSPRQQTANHDDDKPNAAGGGDIGADHHEHFRDGYQPIVVASAGTSCAQRYCQAEIPTHKAGQR